VSRNQFFTAEYKRMTPALLNTARFSHSRLRFEQLPVGPSTPDLAYLSGQDIIGATTSRSRIDRDADRARADFDVRHPFTTNFVWTLPGAEDHVLAGGWQLNGILTLRSGVPFTPALGNTNWSRSGNTAGEDRPNLKPGVNPEDLILGGADLYFEPSGYVLQPQGFLGNPGRNSLTGPGYAMMNLAVVKNNRLPVLGGNGQVQFRLEVFNVLNPANFAVPNRVVFAAARPDESPLPTAGRITRTVTSARQLQLGIKVIF
jgi:hypothetical protein